MMRAERSAIVTGGAGGIGRAVLTRLKQDGYHAISWDVADDVPEADMALPVDVTDDGAL